METKNDPETTPEADDQSKVVYPPKKKLLPAMAAVYLTCFLVALDRTIIGTAIPRISDEFNSFGDIAWYEAGFLLPLCMLQLSFGLVYTYYSAKWVLVAEVIMFEIGSIVAATAPNSTALIVGRVITGIGGAGTTAGGTQLINILVPLRKRPKYAGGLGAVFGIASILGPLLGGYLTAVTWRWCFWINVPIGVIAVVIIAFVCPNAPAPVAAADSWLGKVRQLDPLGFVLIAPGAICLLFAIQWGGTEYPWNDADIIALFVVGGILCCAFIATQVVNREHRTIPTRIFKSRSIVAATFASIGNGSLLVIYPFYLPIWFQAIQGKSPQSAGLSLIPLLLSQVLMVITGGALTSKFGYYTPLIIIGSAIGIVGAAMISTWGVDAPPSQWIGYQVLAGIGFGLVLQQPIIAAQTCLPKEDLAIGVSVQFFLQLFGGTIFVTACQSLLETRLISGLAGKIPNLNPAAISGGGATTLRDIVPANKLDFVLEVYNNSMVPIWYVALGLSCLIFVSSLGFEWKSVKKEELQDDIESKKVAVAEE